MKKGRLLILAITFVAVVGLLGACAGDIGPAGLRGLQGEQGVQGDTGSQGATGSQGEQGTPGAPGEQGTAGEQGVQGTVGADGTDGATGATGSRGGGSAGATGTTGAPGPQGVQGDPGIDADSTELLALQEQIDALMASIATLHRPQIDGISPLSVVTDTTPNTLTGEVDFVFDFHDGKGDLAKLEIDFGPHPYGGTNREQVSFLAVEGPGVVGTPEEFALLAELGISPSYSASEEKWTLTINTNATMPDTYAGMVMKWASVGELLFPEGLFHWYIVVHDDLDNKWGSMYDVPEYAHYVNYFHSVQ